MAEFVADVVRRILKDFLECKGASYEEVAGWSCGSEHSASWFLGEEWQPAWASLGCGRLRSAALLGMCFLFDCWKHLCCRAARASLELCLPT